MLQLIGFLIPVAGSEQLILAQVCQNQVFSGLLPAKFQSKVSMIIRKSYLCYTCVLRIKYYI